MRLNTAVPTAAVLLAVAVSLFPSPRAAAGCPSSLGELNSASMKANISAQGTKASREVEAAGMLPRGSALLTSSGNLAKTGIRAIIHAATGSMTRSGPEFDPTLEAIQSSVRNSLTLAAGAGHKRLAIPFLGGRIFLDRIGVSPEVLATAIVESALASAGTLETRFVLFSAEEAELFSTVLKKLAAKYPGPAAASAVVSGSITDFALHGSSAIVNAANMEVQFGGGLSGAIARATGKANEIDDEAAREIAAFSHR